MTKRQKIKHICNKQQNVTKVVTVDDVLPRPKHERKEKSKIKRQREAIIKMLKEQEKEQSQEKQM